MNEVRLPAAVGYAGRAEFTRPALAVGPCIARPRSYERRFRDQSRFPSPARLSPWHASARHSRASHCGALLLFNINNIRYITSHQDRGMGARQALPLRPPRRGLASRSSGISVPRPCITGSIATGCRRKTFRAGMLGMRGTVPPSAGLMQASRRGDQGRSFVAAGIADMPLGVDLVEAGHVATS